jgi:hypothetical protein
MSFVPMVWSEARVVARVVRMLVSLGKAVRSTRMMAGSVDIVPLRMMRRWAGSGRCEIDAVVCCLY